MELKMPTKFTDMFPSVVNYGADGWPTDGADLSAAVGIGVTVCAVALRDRFDPSQGCRPGSIPMSIVRGASGFVLTGAADRRFRSAAGAPGSFGHFFS